MSEELYPDSQEDAKLSGMKKPEKKSNKTNKGDIVGGIVDIAIDVIPDIVEVLDAIF